MGSRGRGSASRSQRNDAGVALGVLIDSSCLIALERGTLHAADLPSESRGISVITVSEILQGLHRTDGAHRVRREAWVERFLGGITPVPITPAVARVHAYLWSHLVRRGEMVGLHDLWIGATALTYDMGVVTLNVGEFERIPGLRVLTA